MRSDQIKTKKDIEKMSVEEAREAINNGQYGNIDSQNYKTAMHYLNFKEKAIQDVRDKKILLLTRIILFLTIGSFFLAASLALLEII